MIPVFVSRPSTVPSEFEHGLANFSEALIALGLHPRTLGVTDYATTSPIDEVIRLIDAAEGVVVVGIPQIVVTAGEFRGQAISGPMPLPTEWNHLEAGIAYSRGKPLLIIHQPGVNRGVSDRGALNSFLYELDLTSPGWAKSDQVRGALGAWKSKIVASRSTEKHSSRGSTSPSPTKDALPDPEALSVLAVLASFGDARVPHEAIGRILGMSSLRAKLLLGDLKANGYVDYSDSVSSDPPGFYLESPALAILRERGII